jgi:hypothetical protein
MPCHFHYIVFVISFSPFCLCLSHIIYTILLSSYDFHDVPYRFHHIVFTMLFPQLFSSDQETKIWPTPARMVECSEWLIADWALFWPMHHFTIATYWRRGFSPSSKWVHRSLITIDQQPESFVSHRSQILLEVINSHVNMVCHAIIQQHVTQ